MIQRNERSLILCILYVLGVGVATEHLSAQASYAQEVRTLVQNLRQLWSQMLSDPALAEIPMVASSLREVSAGFDQMEAELLAPDTPAEAMATVREFNALIEQLMPLMSSTGALSPSEASSLRASISRLQSTVTNAPVSAPDPPPSDDDLNRPNCSTSPSTMTPAERVRWRSYCGVAEEPPPPPPEPAAPAAPPRPSWEDTPPTRSADPATPPLGWTAGDLGEEFSAVKNAWGERVWGAVVGEINDALEPHLREWDSVIERLKFRWNVGQNSLVLLDQALDGTERHLGAFYRDEEYDCWRHGMDLDEPAAANASKLLTVLGHGKDLRRCPR